MLIGYSKDSKTYQCYRRATHKVVESYHVVFIEAKDELDVEFRPGVTQGLNKESIASESTQQAIQGLTPNPIMGASHPMQTPAAPATTIPSATSTLPTTSAPQPQWSSRILKPTPLSATASGIEHISTVQHATAESIASKACLDEQQRTRRHSRTASRENPTAHRGVPPNLPELVEIAYRAERNCRRLRPPTSLNNYMVTATSGASLPTLTSPVLKSPALLWRRWHLLRHPNGLQLAPKNLIP